MVEPAGTSIGNDLPRATLVPSKRRGISIVWIIPIIAALVAIGIAVNRVLNEGPTITVVFKSVEGLEAGKTVIKYKDVKIGQVTAVELYEDYSKVMVTARIDKHAEGLMVDGAKFWVVQPRITLSGVSGLGTLLSGNYIGFEQGDKSRSGRTTVREPVPRQGYDALAAAHSLAVARLSQDIADAVGALEHESMVAGAELPSIFNHFVTKQIEELNT